MLLSLEEIKKQCKVDEDDTSQDDELNAYGLAASARLETELQRHVYKTRAEVPEGDLDAIALDEQRHGGEDLKLAVKLLVAHFYRNREQTSELTLKEIPEGFHALTGTYRMVPYGGNI
ncbi:head-tail connector protein [Vibrio parahaemolyticus]|uniref:head-tail connector protein n=1 Tax=Vibrio parahaemolyticus TaxID=670 RepID=UPI00146DC6FE|nr:head-tail connector protein [Vibrio parahaemolyticus]MDF4554911.1 head-tail connector protein [Vibrio parahaemolyticus]MDF5352800.1 head-tail connector protein [Vibrio parahaemolyticus]MDF5368251.1 head-tail connector protein [Vibrio parahaemolyticus]MDG2771233.1 head-tail connector protein [Vibrio parahaemolyticus]MDG2826663.1 head-tail connector protein [Vibrio parahaemolyticus]